MSAGLARPDHLGMTVMKQSRLVAAAALLLSLGGCAYMDAKRDVRDNDARIQTAKDAQQAEEDKRVGLQAEQQDVISAQNQVQTDLNNELGRLDAQEARLRQARSAAKVSKQRAAQLQKRLDGLRSSYSDASLQLQASSASGDTADVVRQQAQLKQLKQQIDSTNREIDTLSK